MTRETFLASIQGRLKAAATQWLLEHTGRSCIYIYFGSENDKSFLINELEESPVRPPRIPLTPLPTLGDSPL